MIYLDHLTIWKLRRVDKKGNTINDDIKEKVDIIVSFTLYLSCLFHF